MIGGVAAGMSFAARARRLSEEVEITILERGSDISFANCGLPFHIGGEIKSRDVLAQHTPESFRNLFNLDVRTEHNAVQIDRKNKRVLVANRSSASQEWLSYDKLMLAPGARPTVPIIPGVHDPAVFTLRTLGDMDRIIAASGSGKRVIVVGGGYIGIELIEQLHKKGLEVTLVQLHTHLLPQFDSHVVLPLQAELDRHGIKAWYANYLTSIEREGDELHGHLSTGEVLTADFVIFSIGVRPESELARDAGLVLAHTGHVVVNEFMQTSDPDIYAAGDVVQTRKRHFGQPIAISLAGPASRQARVAADHIFLDHLARPYPGDIGTSIVRFFDMVAAVTGWTEGALIESRRSYETVTVHENHHSGFYPGAELLTLKLLWEPETGMILGAQVTGREGVDKRIDVLATAVIGKMTIDDLCHLELAYTPPFGIVRDVINIAGFAATSIRDGLVQVVYDVPEDPHTQFLDVRPRPLASKYPLEGAINIPLSSLRQNLDALDKNRSVTVVCQLGKTSYFAARVLTQNGFDAVSFAGGVRGFKGGAKGIVPRSAPIQESGKEFPGLLPDNL